ncbi:hypothetical protein ACROYT_G024795, partial [Oculina patagonica]
GEVLTEILRYLHPLEWLFCTSKQVNPHNCNLLELVLTFLPQQFKILTLSFQRCYAHSYAHNRLKQGVELGITPATTYGRLVNVVLLEMMSKSQILQEKDDLTFYQNTKC